LNRLRCTSSSCESGCCVGVEAASKKRVRTAACYY
jgi:hypothetical protein